MPKTLFQRMSEALPKAAEYRPCWRDCNNWRCDSVRCFGIQEQPLVVCATGHRWEGLGIPRSVWADQRLEAVARAFLVQLRPDAAMSGFALGWDMAFARAAIALDIPLLAAIPGGVQDQTSRWKQSDAYEHARLLERAAMVQLVGEGYAFGRACILRDKWMVDHSHLVCAMWSGAPSGTGKTVGFAERAGLPVVNLWGLHR